MKSLRSLLVWITLLTLIISPTLALAQDDDQEWETYLSPDELLTFSYPADWMLLDYAEEEEEMGPPFPFVVFAPDQETLDRLDMDEPFLEGQRAMAVVILPAPFFAMMMPEALPEEPSAGDYASQVAMMFFGSFEEAPAEGAEEDPTGGLTLGEPEEVELGEDVTGGLVTLLSETDEGVVIARLLDDDLVAVIIAAGYPGEFTDDLRQLALDVAASVEYTGTADAIMEALLAVPEFELEESDVDPATLDGNALIDERCTVCHTRDRIDQQDKDLAGWTATVDRMIGYGADLDSAERQAVINYLVETH